MTRIASYFTPPGTKDTNHEGAPTYTVSDDERLLRTLLTGMTGNTFYVAEKDLADEAIALFRQFADSDPEFLARAIVYAREHGHMRTAPITALVALSAATPPAAKHLYRAIFSRVMQTPGDIQDFLTLIRKAHLRKMGRMVRTTVGEAIGNLSDYHLIKYGSDQQQMSLRDMLRLTRPKFAAGSRAAAVGKYVVKGEADTALAQVRGYELFKRVAKTARTAPSPSATENLLAIVDEFRLPWEVVTSQLPSDTALWSHLLRQLPYMALLRNLRNLIKYGVFADGAALAYATQTLCDPERVRSSKQFPFRFVSADTALQEVKAEDGRTREVKAALHTALTQALDSAVQNVPFLGDRVLIANDISGSMQQKASDKSDMTMDTIAAIFAGAIYKRSELAAIVSFDTAPHPRTVSKEMSVLDIARAVNGSGGGTSLFAPIQWAFGQASAQVKYDTAVFITDSESWAGELSSRGGTHSLELIRAYKRKVNPSLMCVFIQLQPYAHSPVPVNEPGCFFVSGWSDQVLSSLGLLREERTLLDTVRAIIIE